MRPIAPATQRQAEAAEAMIQALRTARGQARKAGAPRTLAKTFLVIASAKGKLRYVADSIKALGTAAFCMPPAYKPSAVIRVERAARIARSQYPRHLSLEVL